MTLRDLYNLTAAARGHWVLCGSAISIADTLQQWFDEHAADGFNVMPPYFHEGFENSCSSWCRYFRSGVCSAPNTKAPRCAIISDCNGQRMACSKYEASLPGNTCFAPGIAERVR